MNLNIISKLLFLLITFPCFANSTCSLPSDTMLSSLENVTSISEVKSSERMFFYSQPNESCKENIFVINDDRLISFQKHQNYNYVAYITKEGRTVSGWVKNNNLIELPTSVNDINPKDFLINIDDIKIYLGKPIKKLAADIYEKKGKKIELTMVGNESDSSVFGIDFPSNKNASIYVSDLNHSVRNIAEESVAQISIYTNSYATSRGIKVGDNFNFVSLKYGKDSILNTQEDGSKTLSFQYLDMKISFLFDTDKK